MARRLAYKFRTREGALRLSPQGAFTLIELMVSVAIVGVLASLAVPLYRDMRYRTIVAEMKLTVRTIESEIWSLNEDDFVFSAFDTAVRFGYGRTYAAGNCHMTGPNQLSIQAGDCKRLHWSYVAGVPIAAGKPNMDGLWMIILSRYFNWADMLYYNSLTEEQSSTNYDQYNYTPTGGYVLIKRTVY